jgi:hypothetical protein
VQDKNASERIFVDRGRKTIRPRRARAIFIVYSSIRHRAKEEILLKLLLKAAYCAIIYLLKRLQL